MSGEGLVELARKFVALSDQLEAVRGQIARAVANGAAGEASHPTQPARSSGGTQSKHPAAIKAAEAERAIIELLKATPGMGTTEIARATDSKTPTTVERLRRLQAKGVIERDASAGWAASA